MRKKRMIRKRKGITPLEVPKFKFEQPSVPVPDVGEWFDNYFTEDQKTNMRQALIKYIQDNKEKEK